MKRIIFGGLALIASALVSAQTVVTLNQGTLTIPISGTLIVGTTTLCQNVNSVTLTGAAVTINGDAICSGTTGGNSPTLSFSSGPVPSTWTVGATTSVAYGWTITNPTSGVTYSCVPTVTGATGNFTATATDTSSGGVGTQGTIAVALATGVTTPASGNYGVTLTCSGDTSPLIKTAASFTVPSSGGGGGTNTCTPNSGTLDTTQSSTGLPVTLKRVCTATYVVGAARTLHSNAPTIDLSTFLGGGTYPAYVFNTIGYGTTIPSTGFISLAFTPGTTQKMYIQSNSTFGQAPLWTVSTAPGDFTATLGKGCQKKSAGTMYFSSDPAYQTSASVCYLNPTLAQGNSFYLNISPVDSTGTPACSGGASSCSTVTIGDSVGVSN